MVQIASGALRWNQGSGLKCRTPRFDPWVGKIPWGREYPLQYSCLENPMGRGAWQTIVHGVKESDTAEWLTLSLLLSRRWEPKLCAVSHPTTVWPLSFSSLVPDRQFQEEGAELGWEVSVCSDGLASCSCKCSHPPYTCHCGLLLSAYWNFRMLVPAGLQSLWKNWTFNCLYASDWKLVFWCTALGTEEGTGEQTWHLG